MLATFRTRAQDLAGLARAERARRELARRRLIDFTQYTFRGYRPARCHRLLAGYLEQVELYVRSGGRDGIGRLMVFMPPRHGKSELVSVRLPAWFLGRNPDCRVILASCTADLAVIFSRQVRNLIADRPFQNLFGADVGLAEDSFAAEDWSLGGRRGGMKAAGVRGTIVGRGANLAIVDDPFRDRHEAESKIVRDGGDVWFRSTLYPRLEDNAAIVLMHQRWHGDDLAGRLLRRMAPGGEPGADQWTVINLPALAEDEDLLGRRAGEALWPEKYPVEALEAIRANIGGYEWDAQYQQRPRRIEGAMIRAYDIILVRDDKVPSEVRQARYWDLAVSGREGADYIAGGRVAKTSDGRIFIWDVARMPGPWADARGRMVEVMLGDPPEVAQGIETSGQQAGYFQELQRDEKLQGRAIYGVNPQQFGNKEVRANVWASRIPDGLVHMVRGPWNDAFLAEALAFPRGQYDDQVDAVSGAVAMLNVHFLEGDLLV